MNEKDIRDLSEKIAQEIVDRNPLGNIFTPRFVLADRIADKLREQNENMIYWTPERKESNK